MPPPASTLHPLWVLYLEYTIDVDGDGDVDVLSASDLDDTVAWYENTLGAPPTSLPTSRPSSPMTSGDTASLMALIETLQSQVADLQSTDAAMQSVDSDLLSTVAVMESVDSAMEKDMSDLKITVGRVVEWKRKVRQGTDKLTSRRTPRMKLNDDGTNDTNNLRRN